MLSNFNDDPGFDLQAILVSLLPKVKDPTEFLKQFNVSSEYCERYKEGCRKDRQLKIEAEVKASNRLIAKILKHAEDQGISSYDLPNLKSKSYEELREYIKGSWPDLFPKT